MLYDSKRVRQTVHRMCLKLFVMPIRNSESTAGMPRVIQAVLRNVQNAFNSIKMNAKSFTFGRGLAARAQPSKPFSSHPASFPSAYGVDTLLQLLLMLLMMCIYIITFKIHTTAIPPPSPFSSLFFSSAILLAVAFEEIVFVSATATTVTVAVKGRARFSVKVPTPGVPIKDAVALCFAGIVLHNL